MAICNSDYQTGPIKEVTWDWIKRSERVEELRNKLAELEKDIEASTNELKELEQILIKRIKTYCVQVQDARIVRANFNGLGVNDRLVIMKPIS